MAEQPLVEVRVVLARQMAAGLGHGRGGSQTGTAPARTGDIDATDTFRDRVKREREVIRRKREEAQREGGILSRGLSRAGSTLAGQSGAAGGAVVRASRLASQAGGALGLPVSGVLSQAAIIAAVVAGGAKIVEALGPAIVAAVSKALGIPSGVGDTLADEISAKVSEVLNGVVAGFTAAGDTLETEKAKVRLGGTVGLDDAKKTFGGYFEVNKQRGELEAKFNREINRDLAKQITNLAFGR